ncbi:MAG: hypothetical protein ACREXR_21810 [Gammaproteobacteria bacterium]
MKNGIFGGLISALIGGLIVGLTEGLHMGLQMLFAGLFVGLIVGMIVGLNRGVAAAIKHYALRFVLWGSGHTPFNFIKFLDYCAQIILLKKVGGGYIFLSIECCSSILRGLSTPNECISGLCKY